MHVSLLCLVVEFWQVGYQFLCVCRQFAVLSVVLALDRLTISSVRLPDEAIYVPLGRKTPIRKPGWGSMLSVVDRGLTSIPWEDLDSTLVQAIQRESDGPTLGDLKD